MQHQIDDLPLLSVRGFEGVSLIKWDRSKASVCQQQNTISNKSCRVMKFSASGNIFACCDGVKVDVVDTSTDDVIFTLPLMRTYAMCFSPDDAIFCTWEPYAVTKEHPKGKPNLQLWNAKNGSLIHELVQKKIDCWSPAWMDNSKICAKQFGNSVHFFTNDNFSRPVEKLHIDKLESFVISPNVKSPSRVACFVRGGKGAPSSVRIFNYPKFNSDAAIANKSFFKADSVNILWNKLGSHLLVKASVDVDTTGESYYGEQSLHFMSCSGETAIVNLSKKGPIYDAAWSPNSTQFCVVFGFMPAKACIFNLKCDQVFEFGPTPKNECYFNPQGNLLVLAGFGNLRGNIEVWDFERKTQIAQFQSLDTTYFEWCSDGAHFVTATTSPRLRVGNGYKLWHFKTGICFEYKAPGEIQEVQWQPKPEDTYSPPVVEAVSKKEITQMINASKPSSYVPPHARGKSGYSAAKSRFNRDDDEPADVDPEPLSKSAQKNKKKREMKKNKQVVSSNLSNASTEQRDAVEMAKYLLNDAPLANNQVASSGLNETEKKRKGLRKKLQAIEKLKTQQKEGKQLEKNQLEKLKTEASLLKELEQLELKS